MTGARRWLLIAGLLAATLAARAATPQVNLDRLTAREPSPMLRDPFAAPERKAAPGAKAVRRAPRSAPPLPFTYLGRMLAGTDNAVFLVQGERSLVLREGDTIDALYRVERIEAGAVTLVYLPLNERQRLTTGASP